MSSHTLKTLFGNKSFFLPSPEFSSAFIEGASSVFRSRRTCDFGGSEAAAAFDYSTRGSPEV